VLALVPSLSVFLLLRFGDVQRRVAGIGREGAGSGIFRFRRKRLATVRDADRFFFQPFYIARGRAGTREQKRASENDPRGSLPESGHPPISTVRRPIYQETR
jgi:hypothetical protein